MAVSSYGVRLGVRVSDPATLEPLLARLPEGWKPARSQTVDRLYSAVLCGGSGPVRRYSLLYQDASRVIRTLDPARLLDSFGTVAGMYVAEFAPRRIFVHAGVVGWRDRAILIPGSSMSGKTTLTAALARAGATYLSDEYAVLDERARVHPFPKPLSIREGTPPRGREHRVEALGIAQGTRPLPVGLVLSSEYRSGARWSPRRLSPGEGLLALLAHTVAARSSPERAVETLGRVVEAAPVLEGPRGEAAETAELVLEQLGSG